MRGAMREWTGIMCMIPRPLENQLEQKIWTLLSLHTLDLDLPLPFWKDIKQLKKQYNNQMVEVNRWGGGRTDSY